MPNRNQALQEFLESLFGAIAVAKNGPDVSSFVNTLHATLIHSAAPGTGMALRLPVCQHLPAALNFAQSRSPQLARLASAFSAVEPSLRWATRASSGPFASENWPDGHANATIIGPGGLENRNDVSIGVSLLAPNVRYPDHNHGPEEIYLVLTPGRFQHGETGWFEPGPGGTLHNEPNIKHAMASDASPLLAFWCLLLKTDGSR